MEITGKIIAVLEPRGGTSARTGNAWKTQEYVLEEVNVQYPKKVCFEVFGEEKISQFNIQVGQVLTVLFDIDAHEWNGRWFNSIRAWRVATPTEQAAAGAPGQMPDAVPFAAAPADISAGAGDPADDLPF